MTNTIINNINADIISKANRSEQGRNQAHR